MHLRRATKRLKHSYKAWVPQTSFCPTPGCWKPPGATAKQGSPGHQKLVRKLREVYALLVNERQKNNDMLRETAYWKRKAEPNELMQEKVSKLDRLTRTLGSDEIDRLLSQRSAHEHSRYKAWETNR